MKKVHALALLCALALAACATNSTLPNGPVKEVPCGPGPGPNGQPCP